MVQIYYWFVHQLVPQILETMPCGNNPLINQKKTWPFPIHMIRISLILHCLVTCDNPNMLNPMT